MALLLPPVPIGEPPGSFAWQQWYLALAAIYNGTGTIAWALVDKTGANIVDIPARDHASLQNMQGGLTGERYHLTQAQQITVSGLAGTTWTPTLTNVTNVAASTAYQGQYLRIGNTVSGSCKVDVTPTAAGATELGISIPVASNFGADEDACGVGHSQAIQEGGGVSADTANDRMAFKFLAGAAVARTFYITFSYQVI